MTKAPDPRVGVVGGINMDIHLFETTAPRHATDPITAKHYLAQPGGKGANQARAAARLGASVILVGRVGDDEFGRMSLRSVEADAVDTSFVTPVSRERTGFVVIDLVHGHHITKVLVRGANDALSWDDVKPALPRLQECDAVITQAEIPAAVLDQLADWSEESEVPLFVDPSPPHSMTNRVIRVAEAITPDSAEAGDLTGRRVETAATARLAAMDLIDLGARRVLIKLGREGSLYAGDGQLEMIPTIAVDAVDETGAGDVFIASLVVAVVRGAEWTEAVRYANTASALSVSQTGLALPTFQEIQEALPG